MNRNRKRKVEDRHVVPTTHVYDKERPTKPFKPQLYAKATDWLYRKNEKKAKRKRA